MLRAITFFRSGLVAVALLCGTLACAQTVVVIGHAGLRKLDSDTIKRIYTGKAIQVDGAAVTAINAPIDSPVRNLFLKACLSQNEDRYTGYWSVRKNSGLGASPKEIPRSADVLRFVSSTPGAIGYVDESEVDSRINVLLRCNSSSAQSLIEYFLDLVAIRLEALTR